MSVDPSSVPITFEPSNRNTANANEDKSVIIWWGWYWDLLTPFGAQRRDFPRREVQDRLQLVLGQRTEDHPAIQIEHVGNAQDHAEAGEQG